MSANVADPAPDPPVEKASAEALALRARPRAIARFRRPVLIGAAALGALGLAGFAWLALSPRVSGSLPQEAPSIPGARGGGEALAALPKDYSQVKPPVLGPPLPGDLGRAILDNQRRGGPSVASAGEPPDPTAKVESDRIAAQMRQARESSVMVQTTGRSAEPTIDISEPPAIASAVALPAQVLTSNGDQDAKRSFLTAPPAGVVDNSTRLTLPASPYQVLFGTVISAALLTGLDSDLPGFVTAQVTENVYDTVSGRFLLIPQGSRLLGAYDSKVAFGQTRALVVWQRLTLPDGSSIQLDNLTATDPAGYAGLQGQVDNHTWAMLQSVAMSTLMGVGAELALDDDSELVRAVRQSTQQSASQAGQQIVDKQMDVQPTLRVAPGSPLRIIVHKDLTLRPWRKP
ncbi:TrbI/VirB10 family protein [Caulobacter sp. 602-2]|uniref:TrbI/VirB10 family protein n=1 Tax=Caulobacter sp. 602-2 TaxID=2710887 RepID=A0A6G4QUS3_9CAUL|nr:TrbI/VirB10 family protein [Caulobacter sp. 602-2]NGM49282.1 TrbI/VirB10 family protein [Caulobacter sp. 602-2]